MTKSRAIKHTGWVLLAMIGVASVAVVLPGCDDKAAPKAPAAPSPPTVKDAPAVPDTHTDEAHHLQVVVLEDIKTIIEESAAADKVLVIDFWATWCVPCVEMLPSLHEGLVARGDAVRAVTVTLDDPSREAGAVAFLQEHDALHDAYIFKSDSAAQQALADGIGEQWNSLAVPAILVYDSGGNLVGEFLEGGSTDAILDQVDSLLASGQE